MESPAIRVIKDGETEGAVTSSNDNMKPNVSDDNFAGRLRSDSTYSADGSSSERKRRRKDLFGDCALVEIIHLHDCLRGALKALESDVYELSELLMNKGQLSGKKRVGSQLVMDLERRVAGRFNVIWSVFRAHSSAEDEFIWPALQSKTQGKISHHHHHRERATAGVNIISGNVSENSEIEGTPDRHVIEQEEYEEDHADEERMFSEMDELLTKLHDVLATERKHCHHLVQRPSTCKTAANSNSGTVSSSSKSITLKTVRSDETTDVVPDVIPTALDLELDRDSNLRSDTARAIHALTKTLSQHLFVHLEKEETECMPLVLQHLSRSEIHDLVGKIMGKRSSDLIAQIMTMAVQNLNEDDREEMVQYMKQAMEGTFFDRWLSMSGWMSSSSSSSSSSSTSSSTSAISLKNDNKKRMKTPEDDGLKDGSGGLKKARTTGTESADQNNQQEKAICPFLASAAAEVKSSGNRIDHVDANTVEQGQRRQEKKEHQQGLHQEKQKQQKILNAKLFATTTVTSQAELEKLIRAIATNPELSQIEKNTTIQGLRDSVWRSNKKLKEKSLGANHQCDASAVAISTYQQENDRSASGSEAATAIARTAACARTTVQTETLSSTAVGNRPRRVTPPSMYCKKTNSGEIAVVWRGSQSSRFPNDGTVPLFSSAELAPTYHDGATGSVLGCPHYARACKLRHPTSGRLHTCRLCCEQERGMQTIKAGGGDYDVTLDRYAVKEVMCMKCNALQPANDKCINTSCESYDRPFAKYYCRICHLYDDRPNRPIFHCPYCNTCRSGLGLGIDFRHCMRCNACVSLASDDHVCIPQKLQGSCPICHESLFQSTEPLRGLKCGHVMHLSCFTMYKRSGSYSCPLCMRSIEDMKDHFALLDTAIRMQPMPETYLSTRSNIYCQDCNKTSQVQYHFVGQKCTHCGSYNTRELDRVVGAG